MPIHGQNNSCINLPVQRVDLAVTNDIGLALPRRTPPSLRRTRTLLQLGCMVFAHHTLIA